MQKSGEMWTTTGVKRNLQYWRGYFFLTIPTSIPSLIFHIFLYISTPSDFKIYFFEHKINTDYCTFGTFDSHICGISMP